MKYHRQQTFKLGAVALAAALAASSFMLGSTRSTTTSAARPAAVQESRGAAWPVAESIEATPLKEETAEGNALLVVRFAPGQNVGPTVNTVIAERDVVLRDDGTESDERAGDGTYKAVAFIDFNALAENQSRVSKLNSEPETAEEADAKSESTDGTEGERLDSSDEVLVPAFDSSRDRQGTKAVPKVDFSKISPGQFVSLFPLATYKGVNPAKSLVITNVKVVEDEDRTFNPCTNTGTPMGAWTFGRLMANMANQPLTGIQPSAFVRQWLDKWMADQTTANGWTAAKRQKIKQLVLDPWEAASGGPGMPLNLSKAPFRLLAIVNRVDLRSAGSAYGGGNAGEGRFVYGVMDMRPTGRIDPYTGQPTPACAPTQFTVIIEYGIDRKGCLAIQNWGQQWYNLKWHLLGSPSYNAALQAITDQFTKANAAPGKPNGSALNQLRTNEIAIANAPPDQFWQLREFRLPKGSGHLFEANAKQTPHETLRNTDLTADYVNANTPAILNGTYVVPDFWLGQKFLTNASDVPGGPPPPATVFWNDGPTLPIFNRHARHAFSLGTCSACHHSETTTAFTHIKPAPFGTPAGLSGFMTGIWVQDPADGAPWRNFNEFKRRAIDLDKLVHTPCFLHMLNQPAAQVH